MVVVSTSVFSRELLVAYRIAHGSRIEDLVYDANRSPPFRALANVAELQGKKVGLAIGARDHEAASPTNGINGATFVMAMRIPAWDCWA